MFAPPPATASELSNILTAVSHYAWPAVVLIVVVLLLPAIRKVIETRGYTLKIGGVEVTVQQVAQNLTKQIGDLQEQASALKTSLAAAPQAAAGTQATPITTTAPGYKTILWVDDHLANVAAEIDILQSRGITVVTAESTDEAIGKLAVVDAVISDAQRPEDGRANPRAGSKLARRVRDLKPDLPVYIYTLTGFAELVRSEALDAGAASVITSSSNLLARVSPPPPALDDPS